MESTVVSMYKTLYDVGFHGNASCKIVSNPT